MAKEMNKIVEGLSRVKVIADDFLVVGFGDTDKEALLNHNKNLRAFLDRA